jgi:hypothetical protein
MLTPSYNNVLVNESCMAHEATYCTRTSHDLLDALSSAVDAFTSTRSPTAKFTDPYRSMRSETAWFHMKLWYACTYLQKKCEDATSRAWVLTYINRRLRGISMMAF